MGKKRKSKRNAGSDSDALGPLIGANGMSPRDIRQFIRQNPDALRSLLEILGENAPELFDSDAVRRILDGGDEARESIDFVQEVGPEAEVERQVEGLMDAAQNADTKAEAREFAMQALALTPNDPGILLWLHGVASSTTEAARFLSLAIEAETCQLGIDPRHPVSLPSLRDPASYHLLDILHVQAEFLWNYGLKKESLDCYRRLLDWDPHDESQVRSRLLPKLLTMGEVLEAKTLMRRMKASATDVRYATALLKYRQEGPSEAAREALRKAAKKNAILAKYMAGEAEAPEPLDVGFESNGHGTSEKVARAAELFVDWMPAWRMTPGAITWLRKELKLAPSPEVTGDDALPNPDSLLDDLLDHAPDEETRDSLRESFAKMSRALDTKAKMAPADTDLALLPQTAGEVWEVDLRLLPHWLVEDGECFLGYMMLIAEASSGEMVGGETVVDAQPAEVLRLLTANMMCPAHGEPRRPAAIRALARPEFAAIREVCAKLGIDWETVEQLDVAPGFWSDFEAATGESDSPTFPLCQSPDVGVEQIRSLYAAAADFYRESPWMRIARDEQFRIDFDGLGDEPWCVVVFGDGGTHLGLALCDGDDTRDALQTGEPVEISALTSSLSLSFNLRTDCNPTDVVFATEASLPVATCDAWPEVMRVEDPDVVRFPYQGELRLLEAAMRAIPLFCDQHESESTDITVPAFGGDVKVKLTRLPRL